MDADFCPQITQIVTDFYEREPQIAQMDADFCPQIITDYMDFADELFTNCRGYCVLDAQSEPFGLTVRAFRTHSPNRSDSPSKSLGLYEFISVHLRNLWFLKE